ncbi:MAG: hypothetical protein ACLRP8_13470 [Roseburia intestinalis]
MKHISWKRSDKLPHIDDLQVIQEAERQSFSLIVDKALLESGAASCIPVIREESGPVLFIQDRAGCGTPHDRER